MKKDMTETAAAAERILLPLYLLLLSAWDIKTKKLPAWLLAAGGGTGLVLRILSLAAGENAAALGAAYLPGFAVGALLLAAAAVTREAVGYGDGICFCTLVFWLRWESLLSVMLTALLLCAVPGTAIALFRHRRKILLPFIPFAAAAYLILAAGGVIGAASP